MRRFGTVISGNRRRNCELSKEARAAIVALAEAGTKKVQLARQFFCHPNTITRTLQRFQATESLASRLRKGRPPLLNAAQRRYILMLVKRNPRMAWKALICGAPVPVSQSTIRRVLGGHYRRKWKAVKRIAISKDLARERFSWARYWKTRKQELLTVCNFKDDRF